MRALSRLELISVVVLVICVVAWLIPQFFVWKDKVKAAEAVANLTGIYDAEFVYFHDDSLGQGQQFLELPPIPAQPSPDLVSVRFDQEPWSDLPLRLDPNVRYSYQVRTEGTGINATFEARAAGDLDGDGVFSQYLLRGWMDPNGKRMGRNLLMKLDPLE